MAQNVSLSQLRDARWWIHDKDEDVASSVQSNAQQIWRDLSEERRAMFRFGNLYQSMPMHWAPGKRMRYRQAVKEPRLSYNVCKAVVDTYASLITKDRPKVSFVTSKGNWKLQRKAKLLEKFVSGIMSATNFYEVAQEVVFDSSKFPFGAIKIYAEPGETKKDDPTIKVDRILPWELLIGEFDAIYGDPHEFYQIHSVDRLALMDEYPDKAGELESAGTGGFDEESGGGYSASTQNDVVVVLEAWHLPRVEGGDGRHVITAGTVVLFDEPYTHVNSPFILLHRQKPMTGVFGLSLLRELAPIQIGINRLLRDIERAQALICGHWFIENNANVNTGTIDDRIGGMIRFTGSMPVYQAPTTVAGDVYQHLADLYNKAFEIVGVSQMTATSQKPPGLNSGKAMLVYADVQSQRFQPSYQLFQNFFIKAARQILTLTRDVTKTHPNFEAKSIGRASMDIIKAADALLDENEFDLELYPTNAFADDPAARLEQVQDMLAAGLLDPSTAKRLMDMPDLETEADYENASYNLVMSIVDRMIDKGKYIPPEPYMQLSDEQDGGPGAIRLVQLSYLKAKLDGVQEDRLDLLRRWISQANGIVNPTPPPQIPSPAAPPGLPKPGGPLGPAATPPPPPPMVQQAS
jgi:hypothetical protein